MNEGGIGLLWRQKRKFGPTRAVLVWQGEVGPWDKGSVRGTATWEKKGLRMWECISASKLVRWMIGGRDRVEMRGKLATRGLQWEWIKPSRKPVHAVPKIP